MSFQVASELAVASKRQVPLLESHGTAVVYLTDADDGGRKHQEDLRVAGIPAERILDMPPPTVMVEDLVGADIYLSAVNTALQNTSASNMQKVELNNARRPDSVTAWAQQHGEEPPGKAIVARIILEQNATTPIVAAQLN